MDYDNNIDDGIDAEIASCFDLNNLKSFFLFAGAGSGKTRSLVNALQSIEKKNGNHLRLRRQRVAVITYTNAACDEIIHRLDNNPLFFVHTIHSFAWELIKGYREDIKEWLRANIQNEIEELELKQSKGRAGTDAASKRAIKIENKKARLENLKNIRQFVYNPNGDNLTKDSLNHAEVIKICSSFLVQKEMMQKILIGKFPILLIDESQDTNKGLIESFFHLEKNKSGQFSLGLFGDTMQRIYADGKKNIEQDLPDDWIKPVKKMNHRCPKKVVTLINKIRASVDGQEQLPRKEQIGGYVRLFIVPSEKIDKIEVEKLIASKMATLTEDDLWKESDDNIKILTLEHHMAARRMGFLTLFEPLYNVSQFKTGLLDGTISGLRFFTQIILPFFLSKQAKDEFKVANVVKQHSLFFDKDNLRNSENQLENIKKASKAVDELFSLWIDDNDPLLIQILHKLQSSKLFSIPENLEKVLAMLELQTENNPKIDAWKKLFKAHLVRLRNIIITFRIKVVLVHIKE